MNLMELFKRCHVCNGAANWEIRRFNEGSKDHSEFHACKGDLSDLLDIVVPEDEEFDLFRIA